MRGGVSIQGKNDQWLRLVSVWVIACLFDCFTCSSMGMSVSTSSTCAASSMISRGGGGKREKRETRDDNM